MFPRTRFFSLLTAALFASAAADAALYDNGPPNHLNGYEMTHWLQADDFKLTVSTRLTSVKFWTFEGANSFQGLFLWQIYANSAAGDAPGLLLFSGTSSNLSRATTGASLSGYIEYVMAFDITPVSLPAGVYWFALHNGPLSNNADTGRVYWETTDNLGATPSHGLTAPFTGTWFTHAISVGSNAEIAFQLNGIPGPSIAALAINPNGPSVSFTSLTGQTYRVDYKVELTDPTWAPVLGAAEISGTGNVITIHDPDPTTHDSRRIYRARLCPCQTLIGTSLTAFGINNVPQISFTTVQGQTYRVEYKDEITTTWATLPGADALVGTGFPITVSDINTGARSASRRFYRALVLDSEN